MNILEINDLRVNYGAIKAVQGLSMSIKAGSIVTLIGANGAGKSSTVRSIAGLNKSVSGEILYKGENILGKQPEEILKKGIALSPEGRRIMPHLTVLENLELGAYIRKDKDGIKRDIEWIFDLFPRLRERSKQLGGTMSGGEQQMLAVGRALMSNPELVMLDEPSLGLAPILVQEIFSIIRKINEMGKTVLLIEQNAFAALSVANYAYILEVGKIILEGEGKTMLKDPRVKAAYLGG
ncbi:ABC transporter-like [Bartonella apihabitans]|uniref:Amino acid/amide ABC transporter ATP-binding protein 2, HAAT family n=1 Tax=Bartonella apihabitans TaxID=2750929 RepID=A0A1U9MBE8_9HYPH|nr:MULTISPECIES: ABC transporter ATP-binding protein [Bartonella]AQT42781.1 amino acid/amide ABC transporter ATP-binding protein 2, HAAT family [Bartonella apihabitans]AQT45024.1 amino acid/amide ABC transporter ATP-binding protein 2, HAAT family [Bartonella apihabitans]MBH9994282.1 ABC transporter ATP-binding protein [Bartonella sp. P0291]MBH9997373.1 ABC transporter ATP-binding protein [Bartonella sp. M0192]MBH9999533.1 ABC transporter ATP-binding protein [Bartonella sp. M0191]